MFCRFCGKEIGSEDDFCMHCGASTGIPVNNSQLKDHISSASIHSVPRAACVYKVGRKVPVTKKGLTWNGLRGSFEVVDDVLKIYQGGGFATGITTGILFDSFTAYKITKDQINSASLVSDPQIIVIQYRKGQIAISSDDNSMQQLNAWINEYVN